jgi:signal transduction histidine kinase
MRMRQVLHNLIRNALEALEDRDSGEVIIGTALRQGRDKGRSKNRDKGRDGRRVEISVRDNGPGFPAEHLEQIFEPYVTTKQKGTGLGLAIVRKLIEEHGGTVMIDSEPGSGAMIKIQLPLKGEPSGRAVDIRSPDGDPGAQQRQA